MDIFLPLDASKDLCSVWTMGISGMLVGTVMMSEERAYVFRQEFPGRVLP